MSDDFIDLLHNRADRVVLRNKLRLAVYCPVLVICLIIYLPLFVLVDYTKPECKLQKLYIPTLDKSLNSSSANNNTLLFQIQFKNVDGNKGLNYGSLNVTFFDNPDETHSIANFTIPKFYQGFRSSKVRGGSNNMSEFDRKAAVEAIQANGSTVLRVDVTSSLRTNFWGMKSKKHSMKLGANVAVGETGTMLHPKKGIDLKSNDPKCSGLCVFLMVILVLFLVLAVPFFLFVLILLSACFVATLF